eukprot:TRINITY_DN6130_c0_g1_i1.p1 TRINITY_DN6130_c0_g1~~TRINITY_DN6130_c0_g1_i1.p1  ORF type:complete len:473 (+),score=100.33 TRINITY_DN6130_c0_g1_i1:64-1482(+)
MKPSQLALLFACIFAIAEGAADFAPKDANCKSGATFFSDQDNGIVGCYRRFGNQLTWRQAQEACRNRFNGHLAAARSEGEHRLLLSLSRQTQFWIGANSRATDGIWRWDGHDVAVDFTPSWATIQDGNYNNYPGKVLVGGWSNAYSWNYQTSNVEKYAFICRKDACSPDEDIVEGVCSLDAPSVQPKKEDQSWIAAAVIVPLVVIAAGSTWYLWKHHNDRYVQVTECLCCRHGKRSMSMQMEQLREENSALKRRLSTTSAMTTTSVVTPGNRPGPVAADGPQPPQSDDPMSDFFKEAALPVASTNPTAQLPALRKPERNSAPSLPRLSLSNSSNKVAPSPLPQLGGNARRPTPIAIPPPSMTLPNSTTPTPQGRAKPLPRLVPKRLKPANEQEEDDNAEEASPDTPGAEQASDPPAAAEHPDASAEAQASGTEAEPADRAIEDDKDSASDDESGAEDADVENDDAATTTSTA